MFNNFRTAIFSDAGQRAHRRDRLYVRGGLLGVLRGRADASGAGLGPFGRALDCVERELDHAAPPFASPGIKDRLAAASTAIDTLNAADAVHKVTAHALVVWDADKRIEIAHCGGGYVYCIRNDEVGTVCLAQTLGRLLRATTQQLPAHLRNDPGSILGAGETSMIETKSFPWQKGDRLVIVSPGGDEQADHHAS